MNEQFECEWKTFPNYGVITAKVPQKYLNILNKEIIHIHNNRVESTKHNNYLVGHLSDQFSFDVKIRNKFEPFVIKLAQIYEETFGWYNPVAIQKNTKYGLEALWVNLQKKHEYNPLHIHSGVYSFALWMKIPYDVSIEKKLTNCVDCRMPENSDFFFAYTDILGNIRKFNMNVDKNSEGTIVFFPSKLNHYVNPFFTSDEERISVSGNLIIK